VEFEFFCFNTTKNKMDDKPLVPALDPAKPERTVSLEGAYLLTCTGVIVGFGVGFIIAFLAFVVHSCP
jgi:hypothetical protein